MSVNPDDYNAAWREALADEGEYAEFSYGTVRLESGFMIVGDNEDARDD